MRNDTGKKWSKGILCAALVAGAGVLGLASCNNKEGGIIKETMPAPTMAPTGTLTVKADDPGIALPKTFYGLMTEEINYSYDGGLYAELIQNRIFQDRPAPMGRGGRGARGAGTNPATLPAGVNRGGTGQLMAANPGTVVNYLAHWSLAKSDDGADGAISLDTNNPVNTVALTHSLRLDAMYIPTGGRVGVANDGYWGIPVRADTTYQASFYARASERFPAALTVAIESDDGHTTYASGKIASVGSEWNKYQLTLKTGEVAETSKARFVISTDGIGTVWLSLVSLMPPTYKGTANGNRVDIMEKLADMHPTFLRFPGGNYVEGNSFADRWNWKATIGPLEDRPGHNSPWRYRSSDGMGLMEYLMWCEDLKMEPVVAVYAGMTLRAETIQTGDALQPAIQDALDEIEYITGDVSTTWGAERAKDGHPMPFKFKYMEIGNEDNLGGGLPSYDQRFTQFYDAIKEKHPEILLISTVPSNQRNYQRTRRPDAEDDHYYHSTVQAALTQAHHYDNYDRTGPKIFVGEWATRVPRTNATCSLVGACADAAFLAGLERNADMVVMNCYAPLFVNVNPGGMQWQVDLIGYDTLHSFGSPSYYMQKMFAGNRGDVVLPVTVDMKAPATEPATAPAGPAETVFAVANKVNASGELILKVVNAGAAAQVLTINLAGVKGVARNATVELLTGGADDVNSIAEPMKVAPKKMMINHVAPSFVQEFPAYSVSVIRIKAS